MSEKKSNSNLQSFYDQSYKAGEAEVSTFFENGKHVSEDHPRALSLVDWSGCTVLDVGCGTGMLVREVAARGASRVIALRDANLPTDNVDVYMDYLENLVKHMSTVDAGTGMDGATALYRLRRT